MEDEGLQEAPEITYAERLIIISAQEIDLTRTKGLALTKEDYFTILNDQNTQIEKCLHLVTKAESLVKHIPTDLRICSSCHSKDNFKKVIEVFNVSTQIDLVDSQEDSPNKPSSSDKTNIKEKKSISSKQRDQRYTTEDIILSVSSGESWSKQENAQKCEVEKYPEIVSNLERLANETQHNDYTKLEETNLSSTSEEKINTPISLSNTDKVHTRLSAHLLPSVVIRRELVTQKIPDVVIEPDKSNTQIDNHQNVAYDIFSTNDKTEIGLGKPYLVNCEIDQVLNRTKKESSEDTLQIVECSYVNENSRASGNVQVLEDTVLQKIANTNNDEISKKIMGEILNDPGALSMYKSYQVIEENRVLPTCDEEVDEDHLSFIDKDVYKTYVNPSGFKNNKCATSSGLKNNEVHGSLGFFYQNKATQVDGNLYENGSPVELCTNDQNVLLPKQAGLKASNNFKSINYEKKSNDTDECISEATVDIILSINNTALREISQQGVTVANSHLSNSASTFTKFESCQTTNVKEPPQCDLKDALNKSTISDEFLLIHDGKIKGCSSKTESNKRRSSTGSSSTANTDESLKIFSLLETPSNSVIEASHYCGCPKFCFPKLKKEKTHLVKHEPESRPRKSSISEPKNKRFTETQNNEGKDDGTCPSDSQQRRKVKIEEPLFGSHRFPLQECDPNMESFIKELTIGPMSMRASVPATIDPVNPSRLHTDYSNEHVLSVIKKASEGLDDTKKKHTVMPVSIQQPTFIIDNCNCEQIKRYLKYTVIKYTDFKNPKNNVEDLPPEFSPGQRETISENTKILRLLEEETHSEGEITGSCDHSLGEIRSCLVPERLFVKEIEKSRRKILNRKVHNSNWVTYYVTSDDSTNLITS